MKNLIVLWVISFIYLCGCNSNDHSHKEDAVMPADELNRKEAAPGFSLNSGAKWNADVPTNENVKALQTVANEFNKGNHTELKDYQKVSDDLQSGIDKMVKECRMKGADHEALHKWLEPLMKQVAALKKAGEAPDAKKIFAKIQSQLLLYNQYFE